METWREELYHSAKGTSWEKTDHKYIERKKVNGKWVYRYTYDSPNVQKDRHAEWDKKSANAHRKNSETYSKLGNQQEADEEYDSSIRKQKSAMKNRQHASEQTHGRLIRESHENSSGLLGYPVEYSAEETYRRNHKVDYYKNKGEAFIERLLKKK